ncbi:HTH-type quorum sensing-dependent transcriptional regulator VjbR [Pseudoruegeria aquimaris]|uniref:HTH-type quorum sensing-dependent transcriptional regulator VjbR n=1 Tax=Pseudoruegeria aquimaris TaxID=393663 RepID=A0A1Y5SQS9_9RHOB|nr:autoinducer binding domain-containing protein [Pseudoruegeria aquimaris]SLN46139.1 HTH-type quorum sensing-dependent transcriptional regulator VjbR [Pseudoruegeria aquimaris]
MNVQVMEQIEGLSEARTLERLQQAIFGLRDLFQTDHVVYHSLNSTGDQYAVLTYADSWVSRYVQQGYARIDPVVGGCFTRFSPVEWKSLDWSSKAARSFHGEALSAGVGSQGLSVPIRGPKGQFAIFTVNHSCSDEAWRKFVKANANDLLLISHYINQRALDIESQPETEQERQARRPLSPREADALRLLALGLNRAQVADRLTISENTLRSYIESARLKLGASNTTHAVVTALSQGLLPI